MTRRLAAFAFFALVAACGADGDPVPPKPDPAPEPGLTITGSAEMGIASRRGACASGTSGWRWRSGARCTRWCIS